MFILVNASLLLAAWFWTDLLVPRSRTWRRAVCLTLLFLTMSTGWALLLGVLGVLNQKWQLTVCVLSVLLAAGHHRWVQYRAGVRGRPSPANLPIWNPLRVRQRILGATLCAVFFLPYTQVYRRLYDDYTYQGTVTFEFLRSQSFALNVLHYQHFYPLNSELFTAWELLPNMRDGHTALSGLFWLVVCAVFLSALSALPRRHFTSGWCAAAAFATMAATAREGRSHTATDLAVAAVLLGMLAALRPERPQGISSVQMGLAGSAAGLLFGMKVSHVVVVLPVAIYLGFRLFELPRRQRWGALALFLGPVLLLGSYWYIRNVIETGNPLYPADLGPFWGPFDKVSQDRTKLVTWVFGEHAATGNFTKALLSYIDDDPMVPLAFAGLGVGVFDLQRRRAWTVREQYQALLISCALILLLTFPFLPFSGTKNHQNSELSTQARFTLGALAIGLSCFSARGRGWSMVLVGVGYSWWYRRSTDIFWLSVLVGSVGVALGAWVGRMKAPSRRVRLLTNPTWLLVSVVSVQLMLPWYQKQVDRLILTDRWLGTDQGGAWRVLESLPDGQVVAHLGPAHDLRLGSYGRRLQHDVVDMLPDGRVLPGNPHPVWKAERDSWWGHWYKGGSVFNVDAARKGGVTVLILQRRRGDKRWPRAAGILRKAPHVKLVRASSTFQVWRIAPSKG